MLEKLGFFNIFSTQLYWAELTSNNYIFIVYKYTVEYYSQDYLRSHTGE